MEGGCKSEEGGDRGREGKQPAVTAADRESGKRNSLEELSSNLVPGSSPKIEVSSEEDTTGLGSNAVDGTAATMWSAAQDDSEPSIRLSWKRGLKAKTLVLTPLQSVTRFMKQYPDGRTEVELRRDLGHQLPTLVRVQINGKKTEYELKGEFREHIDLGKTLTIKSLEITILKTRAANERADPKTGFSEIELIGKVKKRR